MSKRLIQTTLTTKVCKERKTKRMQHRRCPASKIVNHNVCIYNFRLPIEQWLEMMSTSHMYCDKCVRCLFDKQTKRKLLKLKALENEIKSLLSKPRTEMRWSIIKQVWLEIEEISENKPEDYNLVEIAIEMADYCFLELYQINFGYIV